MPGIVTHDRITLLSGVGLSALLYTLEPEPILVGSYLLMHCFSGMCCSPDLDVESRAYTRWGPLRGIWWPYQKLISHRSILSHSYLIGPTLRLVYLLAWLVLGVYGLCAWRGIPWDTMRSSIWAALPVYWPWLYILYVAWLSGSAAHVALDRLVTRLKIAWRNA